MPAGDHTCPSARCEPGATLIGVVGPAGRVGYITPPTVIDEEFVEIARRGRSPERRFRFGGPCVEAACVQWTGSRCGVIDAVLEHDIAPADAGERLPNCAIRSSCRWFAQSKSAACAACPFVITETGDEPPHVLATPAES